MNLKQVLYHVMKELKERDKTIADSKKVLRNKVTK